MRELLYVHPGRQQSSGLIGVHVQELTHPVFSALAHAIETKAAAAGLACMVCDNAWRADREIMYAHRLLDLRADGMIFLSTQVTRRQREPALFDRLSERRVPMVFVNELIDSPHAGVVLTDERLGTRMATEHLVDRGHRNIALLAIAEELPPAQERLAGWRAALHSAGLSEQGMLVTADFTVDGGRKALRHLMQQRDQRPTAVISGSDLMAMGVLQEAAAMGLRVPHDLSVIGFDGVEAAGWTDPPLTTVEHPIDEMAETAIEHLQALIKNPERKLPVSVFRPRLRVRGSTSDISGTV